MDKLPAISRIARIWQENTGDEYLAGLWKSVLLQSLLWRIDAEFTILRRPPNSRPPSYRAPSWSWASVDGPLTFFFSHRISEPQTGIIECKVQQCGLDPFGSVQSGELVIRGLLKKASYADFDNDGIPKLFGPLPEREGITALGPIWPDLGYSDIPLQEIGDPWCLSIDTKGNTGLLLCQECGKDGIYRRVGVFHIYKGLERFQDGEIQTITII
jgi:hypothetical protein